MNVLIVFMSANQPPATHQDNPGHQAADTHAHHQVLDGLINIGADLARLLHQQATAQAQAAQQRPAPQATAAQPVPPPAPDALIKITAAFDQAARAVRRCIALFRSLNEPMHPARNPAPNRTAARKRMLRAVEDTIQRTNSDGHGLGVSDDDRDAAEALHADLHAELLDRMDAPDLDDDIRDRPIDDIIKEICRDLGIASLPGNHPWKRRTSADIAQLNARAAAPSRPHQPGASPHEPRPDAAQDLTQDAPQSVAANPALTGHPAANPGPADPAAIPRTTPGPTRVSHALPDDPAEAVAFVLRYAAQARWHPRPEPEQTLAGPPTRNKAAPHAPAPPATARAPIRATPPSITAEPPRPMARPAPGPTSRRELAQRDGHTGSGSARPNLPVRADPASQQPGMAEPVGTPTSQPRHSNHPPRTATPSKTRPTAPR